MTVSVVQERVLLLIFSARIHVKALLFVINVQSRTNLVTRLSYFKTDINLRRVSNQ